MVVIEEEEEVVSSEAAFAALRAEEDEARAREASTKTRACASLRVSRPRLRLWMPPRHRLEPLKRTAMLMRELRALELSASSKC